MLETTLQTPPLGVAARRTPATQATAGGHEPRPAQGTAASSDRTASDIKAVSETQSDASGGKSGQIALGGAAGLTTYRDEESGRIVVRVFDRDRGVILAEFPPEAGKGSFVNPLEIANRKAQRDVIA